MKCFVYGLVLWVCIVFGPPRAGAGSVALLGVGTPAVVAATYQGPGDVFTTGPYAWYSTARVFTAAQASAATSLADLVDSAAPTVTICTLRGTSTGKVDLTAYCPGSVTPAAKCAAATGAVCNISKLYDLTGNGRDVVQVTAASQPTLTFSSTPSTTLPAINCGTSAALLLATSGTMTQAQPLSTSLVYIRTTGTASGGAIGAGSASQLFSGSLTGANQAVVSGGTLLSATANDNVWHSLNGLANGNGASSAINVDGSDATGAGGTTGISAATIRVCRATALQLFGLIAEAGIWAASTNATDRGNLSTNQHSSTNGYNF